ncbi:hypothetical protein HC725_00620 [Vibrio sp. S17_S38]|uniref:hypothetical protein n=1 Tax=Vibrio sp. S17_S38 TaxID=2720229 RepID=UPI001680530E|nr:hypothetical protein [Vibrio sp. S17_S38]MBD1571782.1 hypothetical protein [Vibrio sp. S17_S38]
MKTALIVAVLTLIAISIYSEGIVSALAEFMAFALVVVAAFKYQRTKKVLKHETQYEPHV